MQSPLVELKHFSVASADTAKAVIRLTHKQSARNNKQLIDQAIRAKFDNRVEIVPGSFSAISSDAFSDTITGVVRVIRQTMPFVEGQTKGFTSFASNMFMDTEKNIWALKHTDSGQLLVQTSTMEDEDSLNDLLSSFSSAGARFTPEFRSFSSTSSASVIGGDLVQFVNKKAETAIGYIVATVEEEAAPSRLMVLENGEEQPEVIAQSLVIQKLDSSDAPKVDEQSSLMQSIIAATQSNVTLNDMLEYYKKVFARSPEYYSMWSDRLKSHAFI